MQDSLLVVFAIFALVVVSRSVLEFQCLCRKQRTLCVFVGLLVILLFIYTFIWNEYW